MTVDCYRGLKAGHPLSNYSSIENHENGVIKILTTKTGYEENTQQNYTHGSQLHKIHEYV